MYLIKNNKLSILSNKLIILNNKLSILSNKLIKSAEASGLRRVDYYKTRKGVRGWATARPGPGLLKLPKLTQTYP